MKSLALILALAAAAAPAAASASYATASGAVAPAITLPTASGGEFSLAAVRGRPVYLNFFATWCGPCNAEASGLEALALKYRDTDLAFAGIDVQENATRAEAFAQRHGLTYPIALDASGNVSSAYSLYATPTHVFIDREGRVVHVVVGYLDESRLDAYLQELVRS